MAVFEILEHLLLLLLKMHRMMGNLDISTAINQNFSMSQVVNLGTTTKLCYCNFVPEPHPGHVVVDSRPKIG